MRQSFKSFVQNKVSRKYTYFMHGKQKKVSRKEMQKLAIIFSISNLQRKENIFSYSVPGDLRFSIEEVLFKTKKL